MDYSKDVILALVERCNAAKSDEFAIYCGVTEFPMYVKYGRTKEERKQILMMCYIANVNKDELKDWTIKQVEDYIKDTDEYYDENAYIYNECLRLISELD